MGKHKSEKRVEITRDGRFKGRKGKVIETTGDDKNNRYTVRSDEGTIIRVDPKDTKDI